MLKHRFFRVLAAALLVVIGVGVLSLGISGTDSAGNKDFTSYWAAGRLLVRHSNPYDAAAVFQIEKSAGFHESKPLMMRNLPFALVLTLPLGLLPAKTAAILWSLALVAAIVLSVHLLWNISGQQSDKFHLFGYIFAPTVACLILGQSSVFALLGLTLFLRFHRTLPIIAGVGLALLAMKPHLVIPFGVVLLSWIWRECAWSILLGAIAAVLAALIPVLWLDPAVLSQYQPVLAQANTDSAQIMTLSSLVRMAHPTTAWLQFLPAILGSAWGIWFFKRNAAQWDWTRHGLPLLLVSVCVAPYAWLYDEIIVMPAILRGISRCGDRSLVTFGIVNGIILLALLAQVPLSSGFFIWTSVFWLIWYQRIAG